MRLSSTSLVTRGEKQIETTRYCFMLVGMAIIKRQKITNAGTNAKKGNLCTAGETVNCYSHYEKQYRDHSKH